MTRDEVEQECRKQCEYCMRGIAARYLPEAEFKAMFEADSVRNAETVNKFGLTQ